MKKLTAVLLSFVLAFSLVACSNGEQTPADSGNVPDTGASTPATPAQPSEDDTDEGFTVGLAIHNQTIEMTITLYETLKARVEELGGTLIIADANSDASTQVRQVEDFVTQQVDYIVVCPVDSKALGSALDTANAAGIPVINLDSAVCDEDLSKVVCVISSDNQGGGEAVGQWLVDRLEDNATIGIMNYPQLEAINIRTVALMDVLENSGKNINMVYKDVTDMNAIVAMCEDMLMANPEMVGFFGITDDWSITAYSVCKEFGIEEPLCIGFDGSPAGKQAIAAGQLSGTCVNSPKSLANAAAEVIEKLENNEEVEFNIATSMWVIDIDNVEEYGLEGWN